LRVTPAVAVRRDGNVDNHALDANAGRAGAGVEGTAGAALGYLYWKRGLEAAMSGHMSAHVVMQIPGVMLLKAML
jgi:hypothetical protein